MANEPPSRPPFWTSLPGIFTAFGGVVVAVTGLITALYSTGAIGSGRSNLNSNVVTLSKPADRTGPSADGEETGAYKALTGKWEVTQSPSQYFDKVEEETWRYEATISGNVLTLTGKIVALDGDKNLPEDAEHLTATFVTTLAGSGGVGEFKLKRPDGSSLTSEATIRFEDDHSQFKGKFDAAGDSYTLVGRKL